MKKFFTQISKLAILAALVAFSASSARAITVNPEAPSAQEVAKATAKAPVVALSGEDDESVIKKDSKVKPTPKPKPKPGPRDDGDGD